MFTWTCISHLVKQIYLLLIVTYVWIWSPMTWTDRPQDIHNWYKIEFSHHNAASCLIQLHFYALFLKKYFKFFMNIFLHLYYFHNWFYRKMIFNIPHLPLLQDFISISQGYFMSNTISNASCCNYKSKSTYQNDVAQQILQKFYCWFFFSFLFIKTY